MLRVENVATPATAATVAVPNRVPPPGLVPSAAVTLPLNPVAVFPSASKAVTCAAAGIRAERHRDAPGELGGRVPLGVLRGYLHRGRDGDARGGVARLDAEDQLRRGTDRDGERGARGRRHAGAGRSERVTRPDLVDAEIRERRDTTHGRHDGGAG